MALATKCPHCNTIFRVAADQLKLRGGIVRCGSCQEVFDGNATLHDPDAPPPPPTAVPPLPAPPPVPDATSDSDDTAGYTLDFDTSFDPFGTLPEYAQLKPAPPPEPEDETPYELDAELASALEAETEPEAEPEPDEELVASALPDSDSDSHSHSHSGDGDGDDDDNADADGRREPSLDAHPGAQEEYLNGAAAADARRDSAATDAAQDEAEEPAFVRQGRRRQRTGKTLRLLMGLGSLALLLALLAQGLGTFRNQVAAQWPALKPALVSACAPFGCRVELPAQIDALSIEQGELQTLAEHTFSYATVLRNQGGNAQAWPHIELILNDGNDKALLRRVIAPRDYLPATLDAGKGFPPRSEQAVKLYFELSQPKAAGYRIAIFYP
ncbi:DUF3426 domain-containing protein [Janthinobacterium sp.]|uniref:DUF3426 domain-containing protein n=1 Tax=Janthinobacterium sp. TaxID=1871054 RepID=UPI00293D6DB2|nr:DUF3426 domain-containing protein [Janthinobacterium sp.]